MQRHRESPRCTHEALGQRIRPDADQDALAGRPGGVDRVIVAVFAHRRVDALGRSAQCKLAQCDQVALAEKRLQRVSAFFRRIDLALA